MAKKKTSKKPPKIGIKQKQKQKQTVIVNINNTKTRARRQTKKPSATPQYINTFPVFQQTEQLPIIHNVIPEPVRPVILEPVSIPATQSRVDRKSTRLNSSHS